MVDMFRYLTTSNSPLPLFALEREALLDRSINTFLLSIYKRFLFYLLCASPSYNFPAFSDPSQSSIAISTKGLRMIEEYLIPLFWCCPAFPPALDYISLVFFSGLSESACGWEVLKKKKKEKDSLIPIHISFY